MVQKNSSDKVIARIVYQGPVQTPVKPGQQIGILRVMRGNNVALETPLYTNDSVETGSLTGRAFDGASEFFVGLIRSVIKL
jgi:D-alanyl-D-alanine carboxypeptidase (penicillin-binding protein 5/6)